MQGAAARGRKGGRSQGKSRPGGGNQREEFDQWPDFRQGTALGGQKSIDSDRGRARSVLVMRDGGGGGGCGVAHGRNRRVAARGGWNRRWHRLGSVWREEEGEKEREGAMEKEIRWRGRVDASDVGRRWQASGMPATAALLQGRKKLFLLHMFDAATACNLIV